MEEIKKQKIKTAVYSVISAIFGAAIAFVATFKIISIENAEEMKNVLSNVNTKASSIVEKIKAGDKKDALKISEELVSDTNKKTKSKKAKKVKKENVKKNDTNVKTEVKKIEQSTVVYK